MVSKRAYTILVAESYSPTTRFTFREDLAVGSTVWEPLERLVDGDGWPRSEAYVTKKYEQLTEENKAWPDRLVAVQFAYSNKIRTDNSSGGGGGGGDSTVTSQSGNSKNKKNDVVDEKEQSVKSEL